MHSARRILLVTPCLPFSPQSGAEQRTSLLYQALAEIGHIDVLLVTQSDSTIEWSGHDDPRVIGEFTWHAGSWGLSKYRRESFPSKDRAFAAPDLHRYDLIVGRYLNPICKLQLPRSIPTIVDLDDWMKSYGVPDGGVLAKVWCGLKERYAHWLAKRQLDRFDGFYFVSDRDRLTEPGRLSATLPNIPYSLPTEPLADSGTHNLLFVGALWYGPNRLGVDHFLTHCWPNIRNVFPEATLTLAGAAPPAIRRNWELHSGVSAPGFVDDLETLYKDAAIAIAPIYFGGGTNIKVLEALAYRRVCVTTLHCADAFRHDLVAGGAIMVGEDDVAIVDHCVSLLSDPVQRKKRADMGYNFICNHYNRQVFYRAASELARKVLAGS